MPLSLPVKLLIHLFYRFEAPKAILSKSLYSNKCSMTDTIHQSLGSINQTQIKHCLNLQPTQPQMHFIAQSRPLSYLHFPFWSCFFFLKAAKLKSRMSVKKERKHSRVLAASLFPADSSLKTIYCLKSKDEGRLAKGQPVQSER